MFAVHVLLFTSFCQLPQRERGRGGELTVRDSLSAEKISFVVHVTRTNFSVMSSCFDETFDKQTLLLLAKSRRLICQTQTVYDHMINIHRQ